MSTLSPIYRHSLALLTDLYQLTMACGYWQLGLAEREAAFHLTFRRCPFGGQYALSCGLSYVVDYLQQLRFATEDIRYLGQLNGADGTPLFPQDFLAYLRQLSFRCSVDAVPEGTAVFPREPLVRVRGPLLQCQIIETALLNLVNFQTLIATKAARVCWAAQGQPVLEFGLRRAQGIDGGLAASRAAYVGGCDATSNVLAGQLFDIPVRGTHAHSWVLAFDDELQAFAAYAQAMPNNCVFLVDTFDTLAGVRHAVAVGQQLRRAGHSLLGIRLDSGDLGALSRAARSLLDEAGFAEARIVASGDLDEHRIVALHRAGAAIDIWGVGTRLVTAHDEPALGGVYKLSALRQADRSWTYKLKLSEQDAKASDPGLLQVRRYHTDAGRFAGDVIYDVPTGIADPPLFVPLAGHPSPQQIEAASGEDLLVPVFQGGQCVYTPPTATEARARARGQLAALDPAVLRFDRPTPYRVGVEYRLYQMRSQLMDAARQAGAAPGRSPDA
jgi:nicotinate phosphoribosyltransferase